MSPVFITAAAFIAKWAEACGVDPAETSSVVVVAKAGEIVVIYIEKHGTDRLLKVDPPDPDSVKITVLD